MRGGGAWCSAVVSIRFGIVIRGCFEGNIGGRACFLPKGWCSDNLYSPPHWVVSPVTTDILGIAKEFH